MNVGTLVTTRFQQETREQRLASPRERRYVGDVHRLVPGIAILLAYAVTPGAGEMTENVAHFLRDGHAAHGAHEAEEAPNKDAHGCSGPFQTCPCHGTTAFVTDSRPVEVDAAEVEVETLQWFVADLEADGVLTGVFRPPIA
jgi:hypothetical protein